LELVGILTDRDMAIRCVAHAHSSSCLVRDHMSTGPLQTVHPDADVAEVLEKMEHVQVRRIPVVSDDGALLGMIAQADLATKLGPTEPLRVEEVLARISSPSVVTV
jgi:CBS domain-containing protein